jgi:hypothetical protein
MIHASESPRDDELVRTLLSPLARVEPVLLRTTPRRRRRRLALLVLASVAAAILVVGALAATGVFGPLHRASLEPATPELSLNGTPACTLIGATAATAETTLAENGYQIEWRFQHWGTQTISPGSSITPGAVGGGYTSAPKTVPADSIVWDITPDPRTAKTVFVFVQAANDPNAPTVVTPTCPAANR